MHDSPRLPWREALLKLSPQTLGIIVLVAFVATVLLKAYVIGIVWRCYKYLAMRQHNMRSMMPYIIPEVRQERDSSTLLPDYDEAIAQSMKQPPPPSYQVAMSAQDPSTVDPMMSPAQSTLATAQQPEQQPSDPPAYVSELNMMNNSGPPSASGHQQQQQQHESPPKTIDNV